MERAQKGDNSKTCNLMPCFCGPISLDLQHYNKDDAYPVLAMSIDNKVKMWRGIQPCVPGLGAGALISKRPAPSSTFNDSGEQQ